MNAQTGWTPDREVSIVANTPPNGGTDRSARAFHAAVEANNLLGVPSKVVNDVGRTGTGWCDAGATRGDAHTVGICSQSMATDVMVGTLPEGTMQMTPVAILYTESLGFVVDAGSPLQTGADFLDMLSGDTSKVRVALATAYGNTNHIALAGVIRHAGGDPTGPEIRVFPSARLAIADAMEGNADIAVITAASAVPEMKAGTVRTLAISSPERLGSVFADTPTWRDQGVDCTLGSWRGIGGAADLSAEQVAFWEGVCAEVVKSPEWRAAMDRHFWTDMHMDGAEFDAQLKMEDAEFRSVLGALGLLAI
jgi:putative tricarboxylic transport membrane protein